MSTTLVSGPAPTATFLPPPPPGYAFSYQYAGLVQRFLAVVLDLVILLAITIAIGLPFGLLAASALAVAGPFGWVLGFLFGPFVLLFFVGWLLYFTYFETTSGQTPGKRLLNLRVIQLATGRPPDLRRAALRSLLRIIDWLPSFYFIGFLVALVTDRKQRLGDLVAETIVIRV